VVAGCDNRKICSERKEEEKEERRELGTTAVGMMRERLVARKSDEAELEDEGATTRVVVRKTRKKKGVDCLVHYPHVGPTLAEDGDRLVL
jgi:hypothetical protein